MAEGGLFHKCRCGIFFATEAAAKQHGNNCPFSVTASLDSGHETTEIENQDTDRTMFMCEECQGYFDNMKIFKQHSCYQDEETSTASALSQQEKGKTSNFIWTREATLLLIETYRKYEDAVKTGKMRKKVLWDNISTVLKRNGYTANADQVAGKWKSLTRAYKNVKDHNSKSGNNAKSFEFEDELDAILKTDPVIAPKFILSSSSTAPGPSSSAVQSAHGTKRPKSTSPSLESDDESDDESTSTVNQSSDENKTNRIKNKTKKHRRSNGNDVVEVFKTYVQDQKEEWKKQEKMQRERLDVLKSLVNALTKESA